MVIKMNIKKLLRMFNIFKNVYACDSLADMQNILTQERHRTNIIKLLED